MNSCPTCNESFDTERGLAIHHYRAHDERIDESEYTEDCPSCEKDFKTERGMEAHHAKVHGEKIGGTKVNCEECGGIVRRKPSKLKGSKNTFCSRECKSQYERVDRVEKTCPTCDHSFRTPEYIDSKYCSVDCSGGRTSHTCEWCGEEYKMPRSTDSTFCSKPCQHKWQKKNWTGENGPNWRGGWEKYYGAGWQEFRRRIRDKFDHFCQNCGKECDDRHHDVHHIVPIREFENATDANTVDNVTLLCRQCHKPVEHNMTIEEQREELLDG